MSKEFEHYFKDVSNLSKIDIYRVIKLWEVNDPCQQHALKKIMCAGNRGAKGFEKDIKEAIASLERLLEMMNEDSSNGESIDTHISNDLGCDEDGVPYIIVHNASDFANYVAKDSDGAVHEYSSVVGHDSKGWFSLTVGSDAKIDGDWRDSLRRIKR